MKIFLTGATGFIGRNLLDFLSSHEVYCLARSEKKYNRIKRDFTVPVYGDLTNPEWEMPDVDVVIHMAGLIKGRKKDYYRVNGGGTKNLVEKAKNLKGLKKFIYVSSQAASGCGTLENPKRESEPEMPVSDYGKSKLLGEKFVKESGLPYLILRPVAVYGPGDRDVFFAFQMVKNGIVFLPSGKRFVNLVDVRDVCGAVLRAAESDVKDETFFVAYPKITTYVEFVKTIARKMGKKILILKIPEWLIFAGSVIATGFAFLLRKPALLNLQKVTEINSKYWVVNAEKLANVLGYEPEYNLERGVSETVDWYRARGWL